ncbi:hypothetical protein EG211_24325 [Escherichia coli]|nr:hypothetical protein [Escherichia coli]EFH3454201.1 hypothetical protein [Escherichia coli]EGZ8554919.1 hypothetical protein [Escherichia coli]EHP8251599.1 hypothetical protein [Escherichia coli]EII6282542.1 hypothetical protein [Escherichia coli]
MRNKGFNPPDTHKEAKRLRFLRSIDERTQISFVKVARTELQSRGVDFERALHIRAFQPKAY